MIKLRLIKNHNYFRYCVRKIRDLMKTFPCYRICLDSQGGGYTVLEALHDDDIMEPGEQLIWEIIEEDKSKDSDNYTGLHLVELINFASAEWTSTANHGMRKCMEDKQLLFHYFDIVECSIDCEIDAQREIDGDLSVKFDSFEQVLFEVEELKNELTSITMTRSGIQGRDRWDTPEKKTPTGKKIKMRKDRYSALVMANWGAMNFRALNYNPQHNFIGSFASGSKKKGKPKSNDWYSAPDWFKDGARGMYG